MTPEESYWALAPQAQAAGLTNSIMGKLAKICNDYQRALSILSSALKTKKPSSYLGKVIANLREEQTPTFVHIPKTQRKEEPEIVLEARLRGWPVRKTIRSNGEPGWFVAGIMFDKEGVDVGA